MPIPAARFNPDDSLNEPDQTEITGYGIEAVDIRDGTHPLLSRRMNMANTKLAYFFKIDKLWEVMTYFLGAANIYLDTAVTPNKLRLSRLMPRVLPDEIRVGFTELISCKGHRYEGTDPDVTDVPAPTYKKLRAEFNAEILPFETAPDVDTTDETKRYVEVMPTRADVQYLTMPGSNQQLKFAKSGGGGPTGISVNYTVGFPVLKGRVSRKWYRIPKDALKTTNPLWPRLFGTASTRGYVGCTNKTAFLGFPPHTLVLEAPELERVFDPVSSDWCYNVTYHWMWYVNGANSLFWFDPAGGTGSGWFQANRNGTYYAPGSLPPNTAMFDEVEMADVFDVGAV